MRRFQNQDNGPGMHHVLWTGGWDSTFRVCQLALVEGKRVQPHYIIDDHRASAPIEQRLIMSFKKQIHKRSNKELIAEPIKIHLKDILPNKEVTKRILNYRKKTGLGGQYDWFIRYVLMKDIKNLELCVHKDDRAYPYTTTDEYFKKCFSYPILGMTKLAMKEDARKYNFLDILQQTWFCFTPIGGRPCGHCNPCKYTLEEGLAHRIPWYRRTKHYIKIRRFPNKVKRALIKLTYYRNGPHK
jgi:hypothetical protein